MAKAYMLDTNVFNDALDGKISAAAFAGRLLFVIGVQADELRATKNPPERATALLSKFEEVKPTVLPASSFAFGIEGAGFGQAEWNDGSGMFENMRNRLCQLDKDRKKKPRDPLNQDRDILIAETAIKNHAVLVSRDENLRQVVLEFGGCSITPDQFGIVDTPSG